MAFDGSAFDSLAGQPGGRLLRPASLKQALASFPLFVLRLKQDRLQISVPEAVSGPKVLRAFRPGFPGEKWVMLFSDFEKCRRVAGLVSVRLFVTDTEEAILSRISAYVAVEFS